MTTDNGAHVCQNGEPFCEKCAVTSDDEPECICGDESLIEHHRALHPDCFYHGAEARRRRLTTLAMIGRMYREARK